MRRSERVASAEYSEASRTPASEDRLREAGKLAGRVWGEIMVGGKPVKGYHVRRAHAAVVIEDKAQPTRFTNELSQVSIRAHASGSWVVSLARLVHDPKRGTVTRVTTAYPLVPGESARRTVEVGDYQRGYHNLGLWQINRESSFQPQAGFEPTRESLGPVTELQCGNLIADLGRLAAAVIE